MALVLEHITRLVGEDVHIDDISLAFEPGSFNVLLGRTLAGKTSLLRLIAGLDKPTHGRVLMNGSDVTRIPVQKRNLSMIYQQFINYPNMTVRENIASPLRIAKVAQAEIRRRVEETAQLLGIETLLERLPGELSGGQQQRCAMARALVKDAGLILFDEPLVNLDYKLREALRRELKNLFQARDTIAIYATTEAHEALALGGTTSLLHEGRLLQTGPAHQQFARPVNIAAADLYHEPPLNLFSGQVKDGQLQYGGSLSLKNIGHLRNLADGEYRFGVRPDHIHMDSPIDDALCLEASVDLAEISASETFLHVSSDSLNWVVLLKGIYPMHTQTRIQLHVPLAKLFVFNSDGEALNWPDQAKEADGGGVHG